MSIRSTIRHFAAAAVLVAAAGAHTAAQTGQVPSAAPQVTGPSLPISMQDAVAMALDFNLGLKSERMNPAIADYGVALSRSAFLPQVAGSLTQQSSRNVPSDFTQGTSDITNDGLNVGGQVVQQLRWTGATYSVNWNGNRSTQDGGISSFNPRLGSNLRINVAQPLLRGFKTDNERMALVTSERNREIVDVQLQQRVVGLEASVRLAYLSLVGAIEGRKVAEQNMDIAEQSLRQAKARVQVGQSPQIDIIQSEAQVASNRVSLLQAEVQISTAEDSLRSLIMDPTRPDYWTVHLEPTDQIRLTPRDVDADAAIKNALANRLDLIGQKRAMEITDLNLKVSQNSTLPAVDLNLNYSAQGTSGTQFTFGSGFPPPVVSTATRSFSGALADTFGNAYPSWSLGVTVAYPFGKTAAEVSYAQSQVRRRQQELALQQLELEIVRQVRDAVRQVQNSFQRVQATQAFRTAAEQQLEAERRRFEAGMSTTLELQIRERDLANARVTELGAMIDYNRALILLDRVQKTQ